MKKLFKIHIIKNFIISSTLAFTLILTLAIISTSNANANIFNKFKKGFYFEKYSTAEEAKAALLELHPIGSDVGDLIKTLERAGAEVSEMKEYELKNIKRDFNEVWIKSYSYSNESFINPLRFGGGIVYNKSSIKLVDLGLIIEYKGL
jgi:hypothetical protein